MLGSILKSIPAIPEFILSISTLISLVIGTFKQKRIDRLVTGTIIVGLGILCVLLLYSDKSEQFFWNSLFVHMPFSVYSKIILYSVSAIVLFCLFSFLNAYNIKQFEWLLVATFSVIGGSVALSSNHFLTLFIGLEISHLSQYLLVAADRDNQQSSEASVKFFTIGAISTGFMLFGISLIYGFTGTNFFNTLYYFFETYVNDFEHAGAIVGMFFVLIGLCFKLPVAPFHTWAPDVYQAAPLPIVLFIGTIPKLITVFSLLHLLTYPFHGIFTYWRYLFVGLSILSMIWGSLAALRQQNLRRMLAYSTVSNMGFLLMGPAMGGEFGLRSAIIYIIFYVLNMVGVFALLIIFERSSKPINDIRDLSGIMHNMPMLGTLFCLFILSLAGIPPLPGFFAKIYVLESVITRSAYFLGIIAVITTVISTAYYLNILRFFVLNQSILKINVINSLRKYIVKTIVVSIFIILCGMVIFPSKLLELARSMAVSILFQ